MTPLLDNFAFVDNEDTLGISNSGETVGDDNEGFALGFGIEAIEDLGFGDGVDTGSRLVKDDDGGVAIKDPGDGNFLPLAPRGLFATVALT